MSRKKIINLITFKYSRNCWRSNHSERDQSFSLLRFSYHFLILFMSMFHFYTPRKVRKTFGFLAFSRVTCFFFISNTFISNARLKLAKNQAKTKPHPEVKLLLIENVSLFSSTLSSKNSKIYKKQGHLFKWGYKITDNENEAGDEK